jgi:hypothetical protein
LGGWDAFRGCSDGPGGAFRRFRAVASGPKWGRVKGSVVVDKRVNADGAAAVCANGVLGTRWRELGAVGGLLDLRLGFWGEESRSVE